MKKYLKQTWGAWIQTYFYPSIVYSKPCSDDPFLFFAKKSTWVEKLKWGVAWGFYVVRKPFIPKIPKSLPCSLTDHFSTQPTVPITLSIGSLNLLTEKN